MNGMLRWFAMKNQTTFVIDIWSLSGCKIRVMSAKSGRKISSMTDLNKLIIKDVVDITSFRIKCECGFQQPPPELMLPFYRACPNCGSNLVLLKFKPIQIDI